MRHANNLFRNAVGLGSDSSYFRMQNLSRQSVAKAEPVAPERSEGGTWRPERSEGGTCRARAQRRRNIGRRGPLAERRRAARRRRTCWRRRLGGGGGAQGLGLDPHGGRK